MINTFRENQQSLNLKEDIKTRSSGSNNMWASRWIQEQSDRKFLVVITGNTLNFHEEFIDGLKKQVRLQEVFTVEECDFILVFCPVVSRANFYIKGALEKIQGISDTKPTVLVVLHHTFDPVCVVPDSSRAVHRENTITVDCLFHEDQGLLQCPKNQKSFTRIINYIKPQSTVRTEKQLETRTNTYKALLVENQHLEEKIRILQQRLAETNNQSLAETSQTQQIKEKNLEQRDTQIKWGKGEERAWTVMGITKDNPQGHHDQTKNLQTVDPVTGKRTSNKAKESDNTQHKRDQELRLIHEHLQKEQSLVERIEKRHVERKKQIDMEEEQLKELKKWIEENKKLLYDRDAELAKVRENLEKEKKTYLENMNKLLSKKETELKNKDKELETSKNKLETLGQEPQEMMIKLEQQNTELAEKNKQQKETERLLTEKETQLVLIYNTQTLQVKDKRLEEVKEKLEKTNRTLEEKQSQLREKDRHLESLVKERDTSKTKLTEKVNELQKKDRLLNESTKALKIKDKTLEEKHTPVREMKAKLEETERMLEQNQSQLREKESVVKELEHKLIEKEKQPQEKDRRLFETAQTLQKRDENLKQKGIQVTKVKYKFDEKEGKKTK